MQAKRIIPANIQQQARAKLTKSFSSGKLIAIRKINENRKCFQTPITGAAAKELYPHLLCFQDLQDILSCDQVYYLKKNNNYQSIEIENGFEYFNYQPNNHINYRFEQIEFLGRGSFGTTIKCIDHKLQKLVAIKVVMNNPEDKKQIMTEVNFLKKLSKHENGALNHHILSLIETFTFRGFFCIVTELNEIDLFSYLQHRNFNGLPLREVKLIGRQLADALSFIHSAGIAHSDIKPENIMFTDSSKANISVIDFGCSCFDREPLYSVVQSLYYRSPEVIFNFRYGCEIDTWSFGCVLFELATGKPLFLAKDEAGLIGKINEIVGAPPLEMIQRSNKMKTYFAQVQANRAKFEGLKRIYINEMLKNIDSDLSELICSCIEWIPAKRPRMSKIIEHPFFHSNQ